ncbi:MAG: hypothetical protein M3155_08550, partial [Actinomycetota bacterium]|nr:hypothetical protein [Actinomycetota bacterium]
MSMGLARIVVVAAALLASTASAALAFPGYVPPDQRLEMAREEHGNVAPPSGRHDLPSGRLTVSPTQLLAAHPGQAVRFLVSLDRRVPGATLH